MHGERTFYITDVARCVASGTRQDLTQGMMVSSFGRFAAYPTSTKTTRICAGALTSSL